MPMSGEKGPNEIYCQACGEIIKERAEICPHCGVANEYGRAGEQSFDLGGPRRQAGSRPPRDGGQHDPSAYATTVSGRWHYGVAASLILWALAFTVTGRFGLTWFAVLVGWVLMPMSIYLDREWLRATTRWNPSVGAWILLSVVPPVNLVGGLVYLIRRYNTEKVSPPTSEADRGEADPLAQLRARYSRGELDDEEFERRVEQLVATEDRETARAHLRETEE